MLIRPSNSGVWVSIALAGLAHAHLGVINKAMFCINGTDPSTLDNNNDQFAHPLFGLTYKEYWQDGYNGRNKCPPPQGEAQEIPAGKSFTLEVVANRAVSSFSTDPNARVTEWGDGWNHPEDYSMTNLGGLTATGECLPSPNIHAQNESMAAGTTVAISYESDYANVTPQNSIVFTVRYNTPWKREITYDVPSSMPACPDDGCYCIWSWVPNGCGMPNEYFVPFRCKVIPDSTPAKQIGQPQPPKWCEDDQSKCVPGAKQLIVWNQGEGDNIEVSGSDLSGHPKSPAYNKKCGYNDGAQNDIFVNSGSTQAARSKRKMHKEKKSIF